MAHPDPHAGLHGSPLGGAPVAPHGHHAPHAATHNADPVDPEHDIDAKSATLWVVFGALGVFFSLWIMVPIFMRVLEAERKRKVDDAPVTELIDQKAREQAFLAGQNPTKKNIQQVVDQLRKK